ncbi:class I poly(R)-hydroxyalkanoic acid synthase [Pararobbsia alpina]|uniref:Poly(3-hydroxyalkanoate) polymerase subunit PhaC n=1 Tax=Pararobbsia alpina TaxID=621374 RepID=A0A6S7BVK8_9BURK|nr:class I poly(R)-hydroxyalkanoic acid synthase [Pararobbsia alpina]CAB3804560.1 Poly(3-hydroxyalkanoate) polymerase subunit PhaC [Pararobbsia alpina]
MTASKTPGSSSASAASGSPPGIPGSAEFTRAFEQWLGQWSALLQPAADVAKSAGAGAANSAGADASQAGAAGYSPAAWFAGWPAAGLLAAGFPAAFSAGFPSASAFQSFFPAAALPQGAPFASLPNFPSMPDLQQLSALGNLPSVMIVPEKLRQLQNDYVRETGELLKHFTVNEPFAVELSDRRFTSEAWTSTPAYAFTAAWYLLNSRYLSALAEAVDADAKTQERIRFFIQQWTAAVSPANFLALNPEAQKALVETRGESLRQGIMNLLTDMSRGKISQSDEANFKVGENLANTEGAVVFQNDLIQLIQYKPLTATVHERPLLVVPPCINKYYILDLRPDNSFVRYALEQGHSVFIISWRNPDASLAAKSWDDYIDQGVLAAIEVVREVSGREQINTLGFCVGGTMLATALAVLAARGAHPAASMTLLTTMLDFADTGVLDVFIDEAHVQMRESTIGGLHGTSPGLMRGYEFANTFSFLRPNDLVWNYVVENYLKGHTPPPFDLLFWNGDCTNLPGPMYAWYLRNTYLENKLRVPNALTVCGEQVDLGKIDVPTFIYGSRDDHIVPWKSAYASTRLLNGPVTFALGASGHIAGVINPPAKNKRSFWQVGTDGDGASKAAHALPTSADEWFSAATEQPGSWWPDWSSWLAHYAGKQVKPRTKLGTAGYPVIEAAPGSYVKN